MPNMKIISVFIFHCIQIAIKVLIIFLAPSFEENNCGVAWLELALQPKGAGFNSFFELFIFFHKQWIYSLGNLLGEKGS